MLFAPREHNRDKPNHPYAYTKKIKLSNESLLKNTIITEIFISSIHSTYTHTHRASYFRKINNKVIALNIKWIFIKKSFPYRYEELFFLEI